MISHHVLYYLKQIDMQYLRKYIKEDLLDTYEILKFSHIGGHICVEM